MKKIIELFFARSEQAIQELDIKYGKTCHTIAYNIVNSREDAEECVNEAYLGAWNTIPPAKPSPLPTYICKIVRNISLKAYWRKEATKRSGAYTVAMQEIEPCMADRNTVETEMEAKEIARIIEGFLDTLTLETALSSCAAIGFPTAIRTSPDARGLPKKYFRSSDAYPPEDERLFA